MRSLARRRGEGHAEYVIITGLIAMCALVSLLSMIGEVKKIAQNLKICADCGDDQTLSKDADDLDTEADADADADADPDAPPTSYANASAAERYWYDWVRNFVSWFSGSRPFWEWIGFA